MTLRLEPQAEHHAEGLFAALQHPDIYPFLGSAPPASVDAVRQRIARQNRGPTDGSAARWLNWVILVDEVVAGYTQATIAENGVANLAYVLAPAYWGRSLAYEACRQTLIALSKTDGVKTVIADTEKANLRSAALLARLGFRPVSETGTEVFYEAGDIQAFVSTLK